MDNDKEKETAEFYERLKVELDMSNTWPAEYLFKFIVPTENDNVERVELAFDCMGAVIKTTKSKTGKFTSISGERMHEPYDCNSTDHEKILKICTFYSVKQKKLISFDDA